MTIEELSNKELIDILKMYASRYGIDHELTQEVQEEIYMRMEGEGA